MDRQSRASDIIKAYNNFKITKDAPSFIKEVCLYFDMAKNNLLEEKDLQLLLFLANKVGVPQYFDMLNFKFGKGNISSENINLLSFGAIMNKASLYNDGNYLHKYQKQILERFNTEQQNRFLLTAPTSFGKTYIVYEIIKKMKIYKNILLIFPSISLMSENYLKIKTYDFFKNYKIYTLSEEEFDENDNKIFIYTPERYLSFLDKTPNVKFDFAFVDELYKIDNGFTLDEKEYENERDVSYRIALENICKKSKDILLAGPYMGLPDIMSEQKKSLLEFAEQNSFTFLQYNDFEIVDKQYYSIKGKKFYNIDGMEISIGDISLKEKILRLINCFSSHGENTIIYCPNRAKTEEYAKYISFNINNIYPEISIDIQQRYQMFIRHIEDVFGNDWCVLKALRAGIGIHHGLVPKYIQKEIINLFNHNAIHTLFSTTTITEGVNTNAKNIIITSNRKGRKLLKQFDAKNISGRAGRFLEHYVGRVIDLNNKFEDIIKSPQEIIEHKNYDLHSKKDEVDYQITKDKYLTQDDRVKLNDILLKIEQLNMPRLVFNSFKVISPTDKIALYSRIQKISIHSDPVKRLNWCLNIHNMRKLDWDAFEEIMQIIYPIIKEKKLIETIDCKVGQGRYSLLTTILNAFLTGGFMQMVKYYTMEKNLNKDAAIRKVAEYIYNIFKYTLVKYLGVFDLFYRYQVSLKNAVTDINSVPGLGALIKKLEYNALTSDARKLSDYGVPFKLVQFYDSFSQDTSNFDNYEKIIYDETKSILS